MQNYCSTFYATIVVHCLKYLLSDGIVVILDNCNEVMILWIILNLGGYQELSAVFVCGGEHEDWSRGRGLFAVSE